MGKKSKNKKFKPYVKRDLYVYDTVWWVSFADEMGKSWCYAIPSVDTLGKILDRSDSIYNVRIFTKANVYPFTIY